MLSWTDTLCGRRWRKLEGSDPTTFELIHKVQALQKRLLGALEAGAAQDAALADKQALCGQLKAMLDRRPGPEVAHQLTATKARPPAGWGCLWRASGRPVRMPLEAAAHSC